MTYVLYRNICTIESYLKGSNNYKRNDMAFSLFVNSFNVIVETKRFNRKLSFFDLKRGWDLIKAHQFDDALSMLKDWLKENDGRYDGVNWIN